MNLFCRWVIKDRAMIRPTLLLKIMDMVATPHLQEVLKNITKRQNPEFLYKSAASTSPLRLKKRNAIKENVVLQDYYEIKKL